MWQKQSNKKQSESQNKLCLTRQNNSLSTRGIVTRKEYERQKKLKTTAVSQSQMPVIKNANKPVKTAKKL
jgi:hypothetical protein